MAICEVWFFDLRPVTKAASVVINHCNVETFRD